MVIDDSCPSFTISCNINNRSCIRQQQHDIYKYDRALSIDIYVAYISCMHFLFHLFVCRCCRVVASFLEGRRNKFRFHKKKRLYPTTIYLYIIINYLLHFDLLKYKYIYPQTIQHHRTHKTQKHDK